MHEGRFLMHMMEEWTLEVGGVALFSWEEKAVLGKGDAAQSGITMFRHLYLWILSHET